MKNLFKITDAKIIVVILLVFVGGFIALATLNTAKPEKINEKNFSGISAAGFTYNNAEKTGTIANH